MKVAILQSNYIPWKGYFDIINMVDLFIFHDDLQYTSGDWRNRNKIKTPSGLEWLTIPCGVSEKRLICEVKLQDKSWQKKHWAKIETSYKKAPYFAEFAPFFKDIYLGRSRESLSELNQYTIQKIAREILGTKTIFEDSRKYNLEHKKAERVLELLKKCGATHYISGPSAKDYLTQEMFDGIGITLEWMEYGGYPLYEQLYPPFEHAVTILDLIFNTGKDAIKYMKSFK